MSEPKRDNTGKFVTEINEEIDQLGKAGENLIKSAYRMGVMDGLFIANKYSTGTFTLEMREEFILHLENIPEFNENNKLGLSDEN